MPPLLPCVAPSRGSFEGKTLRSLLLFGCALHFASAQAEEPEIAPIVFARPAQGASEQETAPSPEETRFRTRALILGGVAAVAVYGAGNWWQEGVGRHFRSVDEGWFGQDTYTGGADKLGHTYATYAGTRLLKLGFRWAGNDPETSLKLAAATSFGTLLAVEVMDGFSKKYRFSKEDLIMNTAGVGLALLFETRPEIDRLLDFRFMYWPSGDARRLNQVDPIDDHSGQTYLLVAKASAIPALRRQGVLHYLEFAVGYGSRGYEPNEGRPGERSRHLYYGVSLNLSEVLADTVFRGSRGSRAQRITDTVLEYVQVPGTAALADRHL